MFDNEHLQSLTKLEYTYAKNLIIIENHLIKDANTMETLATKSPNALNQWVSMWNSKESIDRLALKKLNLPSTLKSSNKNVVLKYSKSIRKVMNISKKIIKEDIKKIQHASKSIQLYENFVKHQKELNQFNNALVKHNYKHIGKILDSKITVPNEIKIRSKKQILGSLKKLGESYNKELQKAMRDKNQANVAKYETLIKHDKMFENYIYQNKHSTFNVTTGRPANIFQFKSYVQIDVQQEFKRSLVLRKQLDPQLKVVRKCKKYLNHGATVNSLKHVYTHDLQENPNSPITKFWRKFYKVWGKELPADTVKKHKKYKKVVHIFSYYDIPMLVYKTAMDQTHNFELIKAYLQKRVISDNLVRNVLHKVYNISPQLSQYFINRGLVRGIKKTQEHTAKIEFIHRKPMDANLANTDDIINPNIKDTIRHDIQLTHDNYKFQAGKQNDKVVGVTYLSLNYNHHKYVPNKKRGFYYNKYNIHDYGFNFRIGTGKDKLLVFNTPINALSYVQLHLFNNTAIKNATFLVLDKNHYTAWDIQQFINQQYPRFGQFNHIVLAPNNNQYYEKLVQRIAKGVDSRLNYKYGRGLHQKLITIELPASQGKINPIAYLSADAKKFNKSWNQQLRTKHIQERPGIKMNLDQFGLMTTQRLMHNLSRHDAEIFDAMSHLISKVQQNGEAMDKYNPHLKVISAMHHDLSTLGKEHIHQFMQDSGQYLPATDIARYTHNSYLTYFCGHTAMHDTNRIMALPKIQKLMHYKYNAVEYHNLQQQRAKRLYATALQATVHIFDRFDINRHSYGNKAKLNININKAEQADYIRKGCVHQLKELYPNNYHKYISLSPDIVKLNHIQDAHISNKDVKNDRQQYQSIKNNMVKQNLTLISVTDALSNDNLRKYKKLEKGVYHSERVLYHQEQKLSEQAKHVPDIKKIMSNMKQKDRQTFIHLMYNQKQMQKISNPQVQMQYRWKIAQGRSLLTVRGQQLIHKVHLNNQTPKHLDEMLKQATEVEKMTAKVKQEKLQRTRQRHKQQSQSHTVDVTPITPTHHSRRWKILRARRNQGFSR